MAVSSPMTAPPVVDNKPVVKPQVENINESPNKIHKETGVGDLSEVWIGALCVDLWLTFC